MASATMLIGAGSPYITWFKGVGTNTYLTNATIRTPLFGLRTNLGTVAATVSLPGTNTYANPLGKHIALVQGSPIATSTDGAFSIFTPYHDYGVNIEFPNNGPEQITITEVIDANNAIVAEGFGAGLVHPNVNIASSTDWIMRANTLESFDNSVGSENNGLRIDGNGSVWQNIAGSGGGMANAYYFSGTGGRPTISIGPVASTSVGLQGQESYGFCVNSFRTNAADYPAAKVPQVYISTGAGSESLVLDGGALSGINTEIAIQGPIMNRHGTTIPIGPVLILTNSVASQLSNKLSLVVIGTSIAATNGGFNWTNTTGRNITVFVNNAGVTASTFTINGTQIYTSANGNWSIPLQDQEWFTFLYSVGTPTIKYKPF